MIRPFMKRELDRFYSTVHINDFSSFIKSDFRDGTLLDLSPRRAEANRTRCAAMLEQIRGWRAREAPSFQEEVLLEAAADFCRYLIRKSDFYWHQFNLTHNTCPLPYVIKRLETYPLGTGDDLAAYRELLAQFPGTLREMLNKLEQQRQRGIRMPEEQCGISIHLLESLIQEETSLLLPHNRPDVDAAALGCGEAARRRMETILREMNRALDEIIRYLSGDYGAGGEVQPGLSHTPGGEDYYRGLIQTYTSYDLPPEEIHQLGLESLAVTRSAMEDILRQLGLPADIKAFERTLKENRICFDDTPQALQARFDKALEKIRPHMPDYFHRMPAADCRAEALPPSRESATSWGYYSVPIGNQREGVFYYSCAELDRRSQIRTAAIVAHELLPGHHYQTNLAMEDRTLPEISRHHFNTAFADGWAECAADLAGEMGVYDLYDLYGRYVWDMVLCCRLVVDTGLNALGWTIERARAFMAEHTYLTPREIFTETLRYGVDMPGQALAYKFGSLRMQALRKRAESSLGTRFDHRDYHEEILRYGSIPLDLLEKVADRFIQDRQV